jgi:hypothetical protein
MRHVFGWFVVLASVYGMLLLASRVGGLLPDVFQLPTLWIIPGGALVLALLTARRPSLESSARQADTRQGTKDLFLTLTMLEGSAGEYKPLVSRDAERRAAQLKADAIVPFDMEPPAVIRLLSMPAAVGLLALAILFIPQLDPFGRKAAAEMQAELARRVETNRSLTEDRRDELKRQGDLENENSDEVAEAIEKLQADFQRMQPNQRVPNAERLAAQQRALGDRWRRLNTEQLRDLLRNSNVDQRFGGQDAEQLRQWQRELMQGSSESMEQEMEEIKEALEALSKIEDPMERREAMRQVERRMRELAEFATEHAGSQQLEAAVNRALEAMEAMENAESDELAQQALQTMQESMEVAQMECQNLAQAARDMQSLDEAMRLISMAKQLNTEDMLDGEACEDCQGLSDYAELYEQMMAAMGGEGNGEGTGGEGIGEGGEVPEDDSIETDYVDERSRSAIRQGQVLLTMKTKGLSDSGEAVREYRAVMEDLKQGVSEAIESEQIPPGYHEAIQSYFDSIEQVEPALDAEPAPALEE